MVPARVGDVREGTVFAPFHYGYWDEDRSGPDGEATEVLERVRPVEPPSIATKEESP